MKPILSHSLVFGAAVAFLSTPTGYAQAPAQPSQSGQSSAGQGSAAHSGNVVRGSKIVKAKLFNARGEQMGTIEDVLLDPKSGQISYAVFGAGGFLGMGDKKTIVPWSLVEQDKQNPEAFVTDTEKEKLQQAPSFQGDDQWAMVMQPDYLTKVQAHFGVSSSSPAGEQAQQQQAQQQAQQEAQKRAQEQAQAAQKKVQEAQKALDAAKQEEQKAGQPAGQAAAQ